MSASLTWYVARSAGLVAYLLLSTSVVVGVLMSVRAQLSWPRFAVQEVHRFLAILTGTFIVLHGVALVADKVVPLSLLQAIVPFTSPYRPFAVGLGVTAALLMAAVGVTNLLRTRLPFRFWRRVHYATLAVWVLATGHALLSGTDRHDAWFLALVALAVCSVALAFLARFSRTADGGAIATTVLAAGAAVLALAFVPQNHAPHRHPAAVTAAGVPASFSATLTGRVLASNVSPVVSVVGHAGTAGMRVDLLVEQGQLAQSSLQIAFPQGSSCAGTVDRVGSDGLVGSCGSRAVRIAWTIAPDQTITGRLALGSAA